MSDADLVAGLRDKSLGFNSTPDDTLRFMAGILPLLGRAADRIEALAGLLDDMDQLKNTYRNDCHLAETRYEAAERALNREQDNTYASFDKWSKSLGWGLSGNQPECWALMDLAVDELVAKRRALAEAIQIMRPFAADPVGLIDDAMWTVYTQVREVRAARDFITAQEKEKV